MISVGDATIPVFLRVHAQTSRTFQLSGFFSSALMRRRLGTEGSINLDSRVHQLLQILKLTSRSQLKLQAYKIYSKYSPENPPLACFTL